MCVALGKGYAVEYEQPIVREKKRKDLFGKEKRMREKGTARREKLGKQVFGKEEGTMQEKGPTKSEEKEGKCLKRREKATGSREKEGHMFGKGEGTMN